MTAATNTNQEERISGNINNFAQPTNFVCGSNALNLTSIYCQSINIPGITMNHAYLGTGFGSALNVTGDNIIFNTLNLSFLLDENYDIYFEFLEKLNKNISSTNGTFATQEFDFFIDVSNNKGNHVFKINLFNCRLNSISDIDLDTHSEETAMTFQVEFLYDHYEFERNGKIIPTIKTTGE